MRNVTYCMTDQETGSLKTEENRVEWKIKASKKKRDKLRKILSEWIEEDD